MFTYCVDLKSIDCSISEIFPGIPEPRRFCLWRLSLCVFVFVPVSFCVCVCVCVCGVFATASSHGWEIGG